MRDTINQKLYQNTYFTTRSKIIAISIAAVIGFAVVSYWRGVWLLWDQLVFPNNRTLSAVLYLSTGLVILILLKSFFSALAPPIPKVNIYIDKSK